MGNAITSRGHGRVKIMKLDGQVTKVKTPVTVDQILKDYPGHAVLHSDSVRHMGIKAKPLDGSVNLKAKHLYFLVELPKLENFQRAPRRVRSGIALDAKSRLENLLLARRSISDISVMKYEPSEAAAPVENGGFRLKVRLTKAQLDKMMAESQDSSETAEKILQTCFDQHAQKSEKEDEEPKQSSLPWKPALGSIPETCHKAQGNRVRFHLAQKEQVF